ncbi:MAG: hypothetical protein LBC53_01585, partial [Spirochaetaceae bacterium]|nr:hypothetical protein [Spirochaetaceae bacterium]
MNFFIRGAFFSSVIFAVAVVSFFSGCGAEINPDFKGFIENELRKVHTMTYSVVAVRVTLPPYKTVYETGDSVWVPVNPANPEDGIEAAVTIGGGTVYAYYFESFDAKANILAMKGEDGKTLCFRVEGFDTSRANPSAELRLVALDAEGGELKVPVLPDDYRWKFEREGEALSSALSYKVVSAGGLSGEIGVKGYSGRFGGVYA